MKVAQIGPLLPPPQRRHSVTQGCLIYILDIAQILVQSHFELVSLILTTLQMFTGNYRDSTRKSECSKFMRTACIPAIPVTFKTHTLILIVIFEWNLILQGYYGDSLHYM